MIIETSSAFDAMSAADLKLCAEPFEHLANAHTLGHHVFIPSRSLLNNLISARFLSLRQVGILYDILDNYSDLRGLAKSARFTILAVPNGSPTASERENQALVIELGSFADGKLCRQMRLVIEDLVNDGEFLLAACHALARRRGYINFSLEAYHGGGARTEAVLRSHVADSHPFVCVCDSDCRHPGGSLGGTARAIGRIEVPEGLPSQIIVLPVREIENLIPTEFAEDVYVNSPDVLVSLSEARRLEIHANNQSDRQRQFIRFIDLKDGFTRSDIRAAEPDVRQFYIDLWQIILPDEAEFDYEHGPDLIWSGISSAYLSTVVGYLDITRRIILERLRACFERSPLWPDTSDIVDTVLCWGVAPPKVRAV